MLRSRVYMYVGAARQLRARHFSSAWTRHSAITVSVVVAAGVSLACGESGRSFGENGSGEDAGHSIDGDASVSRAPSPTASAQSSDERSDINGDSTTRGDGGAPCALVPCPEDTECRAYQSPKCQELDVATSCDFTNAEVDTPCASGKGRCDGEGECVVANLLGLGAECEQDEQCGSHHCSPRATGGSVCCDTACEEACTTCSAEGHCDATPAKDDACDPLTCTASTTCAAYPAELEVGTCYGFGQCHTAATHCRPTFASADVTCGDGLVCDGLGACVRDCPDPGPDRLCSVECPCETGQGVCVDDDQCVTGFVCTPDAIAKLGFPGASCLPEHCVNNKQDAEETSVDCGGGCGCRATYEVVKITGVPADAGFGMIRAMSGDGAFFAANIGRDGDRFSPSYPARIDASGVVTELEGFGVSGTAYAINVDGSVIVGDLWCDNPPDCTSNELYRPFRWTNDDSPVAVFHNGTAHAVSASGAIVAGVQFDPESGQFSGFRASVNRHTDIPELNTVTAMSADGEYIAGRSSSADIGALWSTTLEGLVDLAAPSEWLSWGIDVLSADGSVFAGSAYVDGSSVKPAYIWKEGEFSEFPKLPGADYNFLGAVNADGTVVVGLSGTNAVQRAFIWDNETGIRTVLAETAARGLELPVDLELIDVDFLSADGTILVGWVYGTNEPSFWRVVLLP